MARGSKSPAMPLYGKDAWVDEEFVALPWDAQGLFWRLAFWQWMEGSIPADIDRIVEMVGKPRNTRRLLNDFLLKPHFFIPHPHEPGRLYNLTTEGHRVAMLTEREKKQIGADLTNSKTRAQRTGERSAERTAKRPEIGTLRVTASAIANGSLLFGDTENVVAPGLTPQQEAVRQVIEALEENTTGFLLPVGGLVARWVRDFSLETTLATIREEGSRGNLDGRDPSYLFKCIESRHRRPRAVTSRERAVPSVGAHAPVAVTVDDVGAVEFELRHEWTRDVSRETAAAWLEYVRSAEDLRSVEPLTTWAARRTA